MSIENTLCRLLFETASDAILVMRKGQTESVWICVDGNASAAELFGCQPDELLGKSWLDFSPESQPDGRASAQACLELMAKALAGEPQRFVWQVQGPAGTTRLAEAALNAVEFSGETYLQASLRPVDQTRPAEAAAGMQEQFLELVINNIPQHIFWKDRNFVYLGCNDNFARVAGVDSPADIVGKTDFDLAWKEEEADFFREVDRRVMEADRPELNIVEPQLQADGKQAWLQTNKIPLHDAQGQVVGILGTFEDITARKQSEEALRQSEERFRAIYEGTNDAIMLLNDEGFFDCNMPTLELFGFDSKREFIAGHPADLSPAYQPDGQDSRLASQTQMQTAFEQSSHRFEWIHRRRNGENFPAEVLLTAFELGGETVLQATVRDVSERKKAETERERLSAILEATSDLVAITDPQGRMLYLNRAARQRFSIAENEDLGSKSIANFTPQWGLELALKESIPTAIQAGVWSGEAAMVDPAGREFPVSQVVVAHKSESGELQYLSTIARDISDQKQLEQHIQDSLSRREQQMQLSVEVARETTTVVAIEDLYSRVVSSVMQYLNCTHAQLFRYQSGDPTARIVAGDAAAGSNMLAEDYQVKVGQGSIGQAIATDTPVLRSEIPADEAWQGHPLLSGTRSELVVPIRVGGENVEAQTRGLNFFLDQEFDGLFVYPIDLAAVQPLAKRAVKQGMKVVSLHVDFGRDGQTALIQLPDREMGYKLGLEAGSWAKTHLPAGKALQVGILNYRANPQVTEREEGIVEGIQAVFTGKTEIVAAEFATEPDQGMAVSERWLRRYPDLKMIVAINDGGALGAYRAVITAGKNDPATFFVGGIDATDEALAAIRQGGAFQATVDIKPQATGVLVVRLLAAAIKGKAYPVTSQVQPMAVNRANLDSLLQDRQENVPLPEAVQLEEALAGVDLAGVRLGLSVLDLFNPYFAALAKGANEEAARLGLDLVINDPKQVIGALVLQSDTAGALDSEDQLVLEGVAAQLSTAFEGLRLLEEANTFRQFVETSGQGLGMATLEGEIVYANPALLRLLDEEKLEDVVGKPIPAYYPAEAQARIQTEIMPVMLETGQWLGEMTLKSAKGRLIPTLENYFLIRDEQGRPQYVADVLTDITDRKQAEAELENRLNELHTLQRLMTREGWQEFQSSRAQAAPGYLFEQAAVRPVQRDELEISPNGQTQVELSTKAAGTAAGHKAVTKPLSVSGESIGLLGIYDDDPDQPLSVEDQAFLEEVAAQVAEALERARLLEQSQSSLALTEEQARRLALLTEMSRELAETNTIEEAFTVVATRVVGIVESDRASIALVQPDAGKFEVHALSGMEGVVPTGAVLPITGTAVGRSIQENRVVILTDTGASEYLDAGHLASQGILSTINAPLVTGGEVIGTVNVGSTKLDAYSDQDERLMVQVASLLASTIENRRLFEQTQAALAEVEATQRRYTVQAWEAYRARQRARSYEQDREGVPSMGEQLPPEVGRVVAEKKPVAIIADSNGQEPDALPGEAKSSLAVPLTVRDELIGVLGLQNISEARDWTPEEVALVEVIAEQVALAAEQIRLFDETQQRAAREQRVGEIGDKIRAAQSLEEALQVAIKEVGLSLKAPQTRVELGVE